MNMQDLSKKCGCNSVGVWLSVTFGTEAQRLGGGVTRAEAGCEDRIRGKTPAT